jgi:hypothetical protein
MIQLMSAEMDIADAEALHVPVWFARFHRKGSKMVLVLDGNGEAATNSIGL